VSFLGGDALRIWRIRRCGLLLNQAASAVVLDRLIGITVNHVFLLAALPWLLAEIPDHTIRVALVVLAGAGITGFAFLLLFGAFFRGAGAVGSFPNHIRSTKIVRLIQEMAAVGRYFLHPGAKLLTAAFASLLIVLINSLIFVVLLSGW
jgi:Lysylphosphatidylglycerol synthase TM region